MQRENELLTQRREILDQAVQTGGSDEMNKKLRELSLEAQDVSGRLQSIRRHAGIGEQAPDLPLKGGAWADALLKRELANAVENNSDVLMWANAEDIAKTTGGLEKGQANWYTPPEHLPAELKEKGRPDNLADRIKGS